MKKILTIFMVFSLCFAGLAAAKMRSVNKIRAGVPPYEIIKKVLAANNQAVQRGIDIKQSAFTPYLTWLTDPDPRITSNLLLNKGGKVYAVRNFGNQLTLAIGAIDYGVRYLLTPVLMITANSDNQAVRFFMNGYQKLSPAIRRDLDHLYLALVHDNKKLAPKIRLRKNIEANVDYQVALALSRYHDRVQSGRLVVVGSVLDFDNTYGHGTGRLVIININGEQDSARLKNMSMLRYIKPALRNLSIGRSVIARQKAVAGQRRKASAAARKRPRK
ncbi:MAG: carbonic anhydrase [Deltaproteobacteria bacterium]|nr:carbonic anhydrase [Deltaproteobacteria bacterium]